MTRVCLRATALFLSLECLAACGGEPRNREPSDAMASDLRDSAGATAPAPRRVARIEGFKAPESVRYDPERDVYFVSNITGNPWEKDGEGSISRVDPETRAVSVFVESGKGGVTLNAPKGMTIAGRTLWVADLDVVRSFDVESGRMTASIDLSRIGALFLNDIVQGPDTALYVTDTGIRFNAAGEMSHPGPDRIFRIGSNKRISVAVQSESLGGPNGIAYDRANGRFVVAPLTSPTIMSWRPGAASPDSLASGPGQYDGVEVLSDGRVLVTSWTDSSVYALRNGSLTKFVGGVPSPADIGIDTKRHLLLIPLLDRNEVEVWQLAGS
jgi:sugar lactone lactonase YvrE